MRDPLKSRAAGENIIAQSPYLHSSIAHTAQAKLAALGSDLDTLYSTIAAKHADFIDNGTPPEEVLKDLLEISKVRLAAWKAWHNAALRSMATIDHLDLTPNPKDPSSRPRVEA